MRHSDNAKKYSNATFLLLFWLHCEFTADYKMLITSLSVPGYLTPGLHLRRRRDLHVTVELSRVIVAGVNWVLQIGCMSCLSANIVKAPKNRKCILLKINFEKWCDDILAQCLKFECTVSTKRTSVVVSSENKGQKNCNFFDRQLQIFYTGNYACL